MNWEKVLKKVARENGISVAEVRRDIQTAINAAYIYPTFHAQCVYRKGDKPTPEEFLSHITRRVIAGAHIRSCDYITLNGGTCK